MRDHAFGNTRLLTERLSLRRPTPAGVDAIFAIHSDPRTCVHNPSDALVTGNAAEELFGRWDDHRRRFGFGYWVVRGRDSEVPVGFCGVKFMQFKGERVANLFYRFDVSAWGRGFASEAAAVVVEWAGEQLAGHPAIARVRPENIASQKVAAKAGLVRAEHLDGPGYDGFDWIFVSAGASRLGPARDE